MMKGLPCSGKTEFAQRWVAEDATRRVRVSWHDLLWTLTTRPTRATRLLAMEGAVHMMVEAMKQGMSVVVDEENLNGVEWGVFVAHAQKYKARVRWQAMPVDVEESKRRNRLSPHPCLDMDIERKASDYAAWLKQK